MPSSSTSTCTRASVPSSSSRASSGSSRRCASQARARVSVKFTCTQSGSPCAGPLGNASPSGAGLDSRKPQMSPESSPVATLAGKWEGLAGRCVPRLQARAWAGARHEASDLLLRVGVRPFYRARRAPVLTVGAHFVSAAVFVGQRPDALFQDLFADRLARDREEQLDAAVEVARHPIGGREVQLF